VTFNSAAHNKPTLIRDLLDSVLPHLYNETKVRTMKRNCLSWPLNHPEGFFVLQSHINYSILTLTLVSLYKCGRTLSNKSLINVGLLWAAELNVTKASASGSVKF
jgi:hypothetical protein